MTMVPGGGRYRVPLYRYCDTVGDGSGTINVNGDYSGAVEEFKVAPAANEVFVLARMVVALSASPGSLDADGYGVGAALTNGIKVQVKDASGVVYDLTDAVNHPSDAPIKTNAGWGHVCFDVEVKVFGQGAEHLVVRWTFDKSGQPLRVDGSRGEYFAVVVNDDLSGLIEQSFMVQGYEGAWDF